MDMPENTAAAHSVQVDKQPTLTGRLLDEALQALRKVREGSNLTSFAAPASLLLPFSTLELVVFGASFAAEEFGIAVRHADAALRMLHMLASQVAASSQTLTAAMMKPYNPIIGEVLAAQSESEAATNSSGSSSISSWRIMVAPPAYHCNGCRGTSRWRRFVLQHQQHCLHATLLRQLRSGSYEHEFQDTTDLALGRNGGVCHHIVSIPFLAGCPWHGTAVL